METSDDEFAVEDEAEEGPGALKKLREKLKKAIEEKQEYLEGWQRSRADFANYKREEAGLHADKEERIKGDFLESLIPALDTFELSLKHSATPELEMVYKQLLGSLKGAGVEMFGKPGEPFDPHRHEALGQTETDEEEKDHLIEEVKRSGYSIGDKVVRPAQVSIYSFKK